MLSSLIRRTDNTESQWLARPLCASHSAESLLQSQNKAFVNKPHTLFDLRDNVYHYTFVANQDSLTLSKMVVK